MAEDKMPPSLGEWLRRRVFSSFGAPGIAVIGLLGGAFYVYTNLNDVTTWPGMDYLSQKSVPIADRGRFSVLVAHLENDEGAEHERLILESLKEFEGVQVLALDRTISLKEPLHCQ